MRLRWLLYALLLTGALAVLHIYALDNFLYWKFRWFDIPMHMLGGLAIGAFCIALLKDHRPRTFVALIILTAIGWEVFEYIWNISTGQPDYVFDTIHDIVNDFIGGLIIYIVARRTIWLSK